MSQILTGTGNNRSFLMIDDLRPDELRVMNFMLPMSGDYPNIERWYLDKVVPGIRAGTRHFVKVERHGQLVALGIAKNEADEKKICTLRVAPEYVGRGMGFLIMDDMLRWLDEDQPHATVGAHKLPLFQRMFDHYGFDVTSQKADLYVPSKIEVGFNGAQLVDQYGQPLKASKSV
ncbi:GNAT family N-acetyltransferase [Mesorhizobium sp. SP-1A]|uniref:GNAT family N-acetyltransferase n=1 Tax=Mesorhizobium sp. SP-1A TaxID=3077840 RepID=UPI0028F6EBEE|nr:GNAT family N-acetyltransferase [Mesorhizobium sp. SP-1A]